MKVKYLGKKHGLDTLTYGKIYDVVAVENNKLKIIDDEGDETLFFVEAPSHRNQEDDFGRWELVEDNEDGDIKTILSTGTQLDEHAEIIRKISLNAFAMAQEIAFEKSPKPTIEKTDIEKFVEEMKSQYEMVGKFYKGEAEELLNEAILDFKYIEEPESSKKSVRLEAYMKMEEIRKKIIEINNNPKKEEDNER